MDEDLETLVVGVRADVGAFRRDVAEMRAALEGPLVAGAERAGSAIERGLLRAVRTGKFGFEDLKRTVLAVMAEIAAAALRSGIGAIMGRGAQDGGGGLLGLGTSLLGSVLGLPGRATGGPVSPGRAFLVGERGPEVFVPTSSGMVQPVAGGGARDVRVSIQVNAPAGENGRLLSRSARQVARAVRSALAEG